jgi:hypothetical protein
MEILDQVKSWDVAEIQSKLRSTICQIKFTKTDGTIRVMNCTLNENMIPSTEQVEGMETQTRAENTRVQKVYDIEAKGWRSFRWSSLLEFRGDLNV